MVVSYWLKWRVSFCTIFRYGDIGLLYASYNRHDIKPITNCYFIAAIYTGTDIEGVGKMAIVENAEIALDFKNKRAAYHTVQTIMGDPPVVQELLIIENSTEVRKGKT